MGLSAYDAAVLVADPDATALFEATLAAVPELEPKPVANWVTGEYLRLRKATDGPVTVSATEFGAIIVAVVAGSISRAQGREVLEAHSATGQAAAVIVNERGFRQISDSGALATAVDDALAANPTAVGDYRAGKAQAIGFLVGQVMKATGGHANAALVQAAVRARLEADREEG
jgi:aspartyl-tRNA(Asn)/glutamyl-tRNA(Gln) amidotransferase subunit B